MNKVNLSRFSTQNLFQIRACVISARKAKHLDVTTMFTYSHANTPLDQSGRAYYLSYFINMVYTYGGISMTKFNNLKVKRVKSILKYAESKLVKKRPL